MKGIKCSRKLERKGLALYSNGMTLTQVARTLKVGRVTVFRWCNKAEIMRSKSESFKGRRLSRETKLKLSQSRLRRKKRLGYLNSPETREKMSRARSGENHPNYGKHLPESTCRRISLATMGIKPSEETRKRMSKARMGVLSPLTTGALHYNWKGGKSFEERGKIK